MRLFFAQRMLPSVLFLAAGVVCAVASVLTTRITAPGTYIFVRGTSLVIHVHPLELGVFLCLSYAIMYYVSARLLNLRVPITLALLHLLITSLAVIGLRNLHYLGFGQGPIIINPLVTILAANAFSLLVVSAALLFANVFVASLLKWRQAAH
jgi:hypothetical protein